MREFPGARQRRRLVHLDRHRRTPLTWVTGSSAVWGNSAVGGNSAVSCNSQTAGFIAVWGNSAVWAYSTVLSKTSGVIIRGDGQK